MKAIPVLGIPVLNRGDLLLRLIKSIDYPFERLVLVNNGQDDTVVEAISKMTLNDPSIVVHQPVVNLGVAGSWNWIINHISAPWYLLVNSDILFEPHSLKAFVDRIWQHYLNCGLIHGAPLNQPDNGYSLFAISQWLHKKVGSFDENFYPAYMEDCDFNYRCKLAGVKNLMISDLNVIHGEEPYWGSTTIHSDPHFYKMNQVTHQNNFRYYWEKWGGEPGKEMFTSPFDQVKYDIDFWELNTRLRASNSVWKKN